LASYGLLIALSGFEFDKGNGYIGFSPIINQNKFKTFWALDDVWGNYSQSQTNARIEILFGTIALKKLKISHFRNHSFLRLVTHDINIQVQCDKEGIILVQNEIILMKDQTLEVSTIEQSN